MGMNFAAGESSFENWLVFVVVVGCEEGAGRALGFPFPLVYLGGRVAAAAAVVVAAHFRLHHLSPHFSSEILANFAFPVHPAKLRSELANSAYSQSHLFLPHSHLSGCASPLDQPHTYANRSPHPGAYS